MPHTLVGIGATGFWIFLWLWLLFGTNLKGVVTGTEIYAFNDPATGREFTAETEVGKREDWERADPGQQVIVLYAPTNPKQSTVYEFGGYKVAFENGERLWT